ncbi:MAG: hypothetical protein ABW321_13805 [Polyangiales bacterium]
MAESGREVLDRAYRELEKEVPARVGRAIGWLRQPRMRWLRIIAGLTFLVAGCLWFLPVVGIELLPVGLLLLADDVPWLRKPIGHAILWLVGRWRVFVAGWRRWRARHVRQRS